VASGTSGVQIWDLRAELLGTPAAILSFQSRMTADTARAEVLVSVGGVRGETVAEVPPTDDCTSIRIDLSAFGGRVIQVGFSFTEAGGEPASGGWQVRQVTTR
jgi:hypothetical protein